MRCLRLSLFCSVLFLVSLFVSFLHVSNVSALEDVVYNVSSGDSTLNVCGSNSSVICSDYSYIIFEPVPLYNSYQALTFGSTNIRIPTFATTILSIPSSISSLFFSIGNNTSSITITLTNTLPASDCPVCEECQVCPAIPENPYDDKFDKVITAIYVCAATILVVYFFYCIYRMIIKSSGGF